MKYRWVFSLFFAGISQAHAATDMSAADIVMLPPYCDAKIGRKAPEAVALWLGNMGRENWVHLHHYCGGLIEINRYYQGTTERKKANLGNAVREFKYVLDRWQPDFYLRAEAHLNRARAYKLMRQVGLAFADFKKAHELNPRLVQASIGLTDAYVQQGKKKEALAVLKSAIELNPDSKSLRRHYAELGGDPDVLSIPESPPPAEPAPTTATMPEDALPALTDSPATGTAEKLPVQLVEPKIGSPDNPYCRFCPD